MTGPDNSSTRPISVAELLAKNGTIGAPPAGGRRRRRRGNADAVTVAELTGEIPIISDRTGAIPVVTPEPESPEPPVEEVAPTEPETPEVPPQEPDEAEVPEEAVAEEAVADERADEPADAVTDEVATAEVPVEDTVTEDTVIQNAVVGDVDTAEADYAAHLQAREAIDDPVDFTPQRRRPWSFPSRGSAPRGAEEMSPDPVVEIDEDDDFLDNGDLLDPPIELDDPALLEVDEDDDLDDDDLDDDLDNERKDDDKAPSYYRSTAGPLFGGQSVADDMARRGPDAPADVVDLDVDDDREPVATERPGRMSGFLRGAWVVGQCILAVAFGAGLFIAFDQLWKWNNIVALVLSVLVILGLVVGVRVVRKTEDIGSTLIAVAVGALVTLGPLALLQSG
ncbi:hypothetical protein JRC04_17550 [Mycolicibacterium sp. S2-37]|uniref:hypothetical protein n=1 Tax=Mycolicibacterium sp. S2-37 TaxID=2810297 RepID=UPI001A945705|nr:hypothetical protein [Mycolicibacterium sp. S2-37]MBO0679273.1 hypothetical protein [Mycolicibacterium sp. S2-37]